MNIQLKTLFFISSIVAGSLYAQQQLAEADLPVIPDTPESVLQEKKESTVESKPSQSELYKREQQAIEDERLREIERKKRNSLSQRNKLRHQRTESTFINEESDTAACKYEVLPAIGLYIESGSIDFQNVSFVDYETDGMQNFALTQSDASMIYGITGNLPFNNYIGINLLIAGQQMNLKLQSAGGTRDIDLLNLIVQPGIELGFPLYTNTTLKAMLYPYVFGSGITGKNFLDKSATNFDNGQFWGYAYGGGIKAAWHRFHIQAGLRSSYQIWHLTYDVTKIAIGTTEEQYKFMYEWETFLNPFLTITIGFY